jgi:hypothetical protein
MTCTQDSVSSPVSENTRGGGGVQPWDNTLGRCQDYDCRPSSLWRAHLVSRHVTQSSGIIQYIRFLELVCLSRRQHAERGAYFHVHFAYFADHLKNTLEAAFPTRQISPCGAHAEASATVLLRLTCSLKHRLNFQETGGLGCGCVPR